MGRMSLQDRLILVVEDEFLIAEDLEDKFADVGARVIGPAPTIEAALGLIDAQPRIDGALVDVNLGGKPAYSVVDALQSRGIPFVLTSGYEDEVLRSRYPFAKSCQKPYEFADVEKALIAALSAQTPLG